jgi:enamine deaminase RidA (YjgF/YER057c/UK114 family)
MIGISGEKGGRMSDIKAILPEGWARGPGFSWGMSAGSGRLVTIAGQLATEKGGIPVDPAMPFVKQFGLALRNVADVVRAAGGKPTNIMMLRAYVRDMNAFKGSPAEIREAWLAALGKHFPAMTIIGVTMLFDPNALVEIDGLAVIQD